MRWSGSSNDADVPRHVDQSIRKAKEIRATKLGEMIDWLELLAQGVVVEPEGLDPTILDRERRAATELWGWVELLLEALEELKGITSAEWWLQQTAESGPQILQRVLEFGVLPALDGTDWQVQEARPIRLQQVAALESWLSQPPGTRDNGEEFLQMWERDLVAKLESMTGAAFWIRHRGSSPEQMFDIVRTEVPYRDLSVVSEFLEQDYRDPTFEMNPWESEAALAEDEDVPWDSETSEEGW